MNSFRTEKSKLKKLGVRPTKEKGQNFLNNPFVAGEIIDFANFSNHESIIEFGPGLGALTSELIARKTNLQAVVEIEKALCDLLQAKYPNLKIINSDLLNLDLSIFKNQLTLIGNLPYSIATRLLVNLLRQRKYIKRAIFMFQKEVAERIGAKPGNKSYGALSVQVQTVAKVSFGPIIPPEVFHPKPKINSQLINLDFSNSPELTEAEYQSIVKLTRAAFLKRRKKLTNNLNINDQVLIDLSIDPNVRAEDLSPEQYARINLAFVSKKM